MEQRPRSGLVMFEPKAPVGCRSTDTTGFIGP
jgi:hypothetical protein